MTDLPAGAHDVALLPSSPRKVRWRKLCLKELRETLRDRRTLITLILMPLLVYPILSMVLQRSLLSLWTSERAQILLGVTNLETAEFLKDNLLLGDRYLQQERGQDGANGGAEPPAQGTELSRLLPSEAVIQDLRFLRDDDLEASVRSEKIDVAILAPQESETGRYELIYRGHSAMSLRALKFVEQRLFAVNELVLRQRLREAGHSAKLLFRTRRQPLEMDAQDKTLASVIPMILILMTVTGAVYPSIDLTAGERERGTLEMLMASPVPRLKLLLAKYAAVVTVAFLTAVVNLAAMGITLQATGLAQMLFGQDGIDLLRVLQILALLVLFAAFFSAVLLALTSFARSFKEAQAYLIPLMLLSLGPGLVSLLPGLELNGLLCVTPISNMVLLARDVCAGSVDPLMATVAVLSTAVYTLAAIGIAAKIFGADAIMSGSRVSLGDAFRPNSSRGVSTVSGALFCLAVVFPIYFIVANVLGRQRELTIPVRLMLSALATSFLFGLIPGVAARLQRLRFRQAFLLRKAPWYAYPIAVVVGLTVWPLAHELVLLMEWLGVSTIGTQQLEQATKLLEEIRTVTPLLVLAAMAVVPAVFEELFFRGYLFSALREGSSRRTTILVTALLFGLFHVLLNGALSVERMMPSTLMGLILGWLCYQSRSVLPGMVLHACHNGVLMMIGYYQKELEAWGVGIKEATHLPLMWVATSAVILVLGMALMGWVPNRSAGAGRASSERARESRDGN